MKKICIRVDGNEIIATGHVMRCLSVAYQLNELGADVEFVVADERPCPMIEEKGFKCHILNSIWNDMEKEIAPFSDYLKKRHTDVCLLDSYYVTEIYLREVSKLTKVCYVDDLDKFLYPVHTLINYSLQSDKGYSKKYKEAGLSTIFLLGGDYAPLRPEFDYVEYRIKDNVSKVLITTGGTDQFNMSFKLLEAFMDKVDLKELEYHVIVGRFNENKHKLYELASSYNNIIIHENVVSMSEYMRDCDIAISAAGTTTFELCACGIPSICFEVADNQSGANVWEEKGYMLYAGNACNMQEECIDLCQKKLLRLMNEYSLRKELSDKMQSLVDGRGAKRIAEYLINMN